jgi:ornithine carbamoyltransferase
MTMKQTLSVRKAVFNAEQAARGEGAKAADPAHLLIGLLDQPDSVACYMLTRLGVDKEALRRETAPGPIATSAWTGEIALSEAALDVLVKADEAAIDLGDLFTGTEHMLVGLARVSSPIGDRMSAHGADTTRLIDEIARLREAPEPHVIADGTGSVDSPIVRIVGQIIVEALQANADAIHIDPTEGDLRVGYLVHGAVSEAMTVPRHIVIPLMSRFRSMINIPPASGPTLNVARASLPADHPVLAAPESLGSIRISYQDNQWDLMVETEALEVGERMTLRLMVCPPLEAIPEETGARAPTRGTGVPSQRMAPPVGPSPIADVLVNHALRGRDILGIEQLTGDEIMLILDVAARLKANKFDSTQTQFANGQTLAMLFEKPSLRTRVTFEAGMTQLGGNAIYLEGRLGVRETVPDVARNLDRWIDGIMARTFAHQTVIDLAENARIPVINGLSDREHPCQALADFQTIGERKGRLTGLKLAYVGDGNNVSNSLMLVAAKLGVHFSLACPAGYEPDAALWDVALACAAQTGAKLELTSDPRAAVDGADAVYTDVWASMGQEEETEKRAKAFADYQLNSALMIVADREALAMHCLPAHRGQEISDDVIDGPQSVVFDQAENRLHAQKAILALVL